MGRGKLVGNETPLRQKGSFTDGEAQRGRPTQTPTDTNKLKNTLFHMKKVTEEAGVCLVTVDFKIGRLIGFFSVY